MTSLFKSHLKYFVGQSRDRRTKTNNFVNLWPICFENIHFSKISIFQNYWFFRIINFRKNPFSSICFSKLSIFWNIHFVEISIFLEYSFCGNIHIWKYLYLEYAFFENIHFLEISIFLKLSIFKPFFEIDWWLDEIRI